MARGERQEEKRRARRTESHAEEQSDPRREGLREWIKGDAQEP